MPKHEVEKSKPQSHTLHLYDDEDTFNSEFIQASDDLLTYQFTRGKSLIFGSLKTHSISAIHSEVHKRESISGLLWGLLALILAVAMYFILDNQTLKFIGAGILAAMAVYIFVDFYKQSSVNQLIITTHHGEVRIPCGRPLGNEHIQDVLRHTSQNQGQVPSEYQQIGRIFTPR